MENVNKCKFNVFRKFFDVRRMTLSYNKVGHPIPPQQKTNMTHKLLLICISMYRGKTEFGKLV